MKKRILFIITSDPRASPRAAEAVRIAAGIGAWDKVEPAVYLRGPAVLLLDEEAEEYPDGENYRRYLPVLAERGWTVYVQQAPAASKPSGAPGLEALVEARPTVVAIDEAQLAELAAASQCVVRF
jgi:hypothetical protein